MSLAPVIAKKNHVFDPNTFLATIGKGRKNFTVSRKQAIFAQGDVADAVFYVQKGKVRLTVVSRVGKEATIGTMDRGNFFGEGALAGQEGTTRSRVSFFMNRFRKLSFIQYVGGFEGGLQVHNSLLNVVLHD